MQSALWVTCGFVWPLIALPTTALQKPLIPVTVQDQIRLWELEKNRVKSDEGTALISIDMMQTPALLLSRRFMSRAKFAGILN